MERASIVWKKMLSGGFKESRPTNTDTGWVVDLPEDHPEPLLIVLNIIHSRFALVPKKLTMRELYNTLVLTEKYDVTEITRPWARQWMNHVRQAKSPLQMWVAWALGDATTFVVTVDMLVMRCTVDADGRLVTPKGWYLDHARFEALRPDDILDRIAALRLRFLTDIIAPLDLLISLLKKAESGCCSLCAMTMLGSLIISAAKSGLDPIPRSGSEFLGSVRELVEKLDGLNVTFPHESRKTADPLPTLRSLTQETIKIKSRLFPAPTWTTL